MGDKQTLYEQSEIRHEQCRFGIFASEAYHVDALDKILAGVSLGESVDALLKRLKASIE